MTFTNHGERFQVERIGPVTCLCWNLSDMTLWRFTTDELRDIINAG